MEICYLQGTHLIWLRARRGGADRTRQSNYAFTPNTYMALAFWGVQTLVPRY
jgi:hypothetical protein